MSYIQILCSTLGNQVAKHRVSGVNSNKKIPGFQIQEQIVGVGVNNQTIDLTKMNTN